MKKILPLAFVGIMSVMAFAPEAQAGDRITLGRTILLEKGNLPAKAPLVICRMAKSVKIKAEKRLELRKIVVKFQNGEEQKIDFYRNLNRNEETAWRPVSWQNERCIKQIDVYGNSKDRLQAGVKILGLQK